MNATTPVAVPIVVDLTASYGSLLVGIYLSCIVWGMSTLQTFIYYMNFWERDRLWRRLFIAFLWVTDTTSTAMVAASVWPVLIGEWGNVANLSKTSLLLMHHGWVAAIVVFGVQMFFIHRVYVFGNRSWPLPLFLSLLAVYQIVGIIPYDVIVFGDQGKLAALSDHIPNDLGISMRAASAAVDIIVAVELLRLVMYHGLGTYANTKRMVFRVMLVTINTGLWTAILAIIDLALLAAQPNSLRFTILELPLCSFYFSTLLANLNSREYMRGGNDAHWNEPSLSIVGRSDTAQAGSNAFHLSSLSKSSLSKASTKRPHSPTEAKSGSPVEYIMTAEMRAD